MSVSHSVHTLPTALPPDCLELLRAPALPPALSRVLACASYSLDAATGVKTGALDLLQLCASGASAPAPLLSLSGVGGAVFDARWLPGVKALLILPNDGAVDVSLTLDVPLDAYGLGGAAFLDVTVLYGGDAAPQDLSPTRLPTCKPPRTSPGISGPGGAC